MYLRVAHAGIRCWIVHSFQMWIFMWSFMWILLTPYTHVQYRKNESSAVKWGKATQHWNHRDYRKTTFQVNPIVTPSTYRVQSSWEGGRGGSLSLKHCSFPHKNLKEYLKKNCKEYSSRCGFTSQIASESISEDLKSLIFFWGAYPPRQHFIQQNPR